MTIQQDRPKRIVTIEAKQKMSDSGKKRWSKMTEEEILQATEKFQKAGTKAMKKKYAGMTKKEKSQSMEKFQKASQKGRKEKFANMTKKERKQYMDKCQKAGTKAMAKKLANMTDKQKLKHMASFIRAGNKAIHKILVSETKEERLKRLEHWIIAGNKARTKASQLANPSSIEKKIWKELDKLNIKYKTQVPICGGIFIVDICFSFMKVIVECNGTFWHDYEIFPEKKIRDNAVDKWAIRNGFKIIWLWESEINKNPEQALIKGLEKKGIKL